MYNTNNKCKVIRGDETLTIYLDIILLENLLMNYIIVFATGLITKVQIKQVNLILASFIGAVYAVLSYLTAMQIYSNFILKLILSICMVYVAYRSKNVKALCKHLLIFYLTSFAFGGCAFALLYYIRPQDILMKNGVYIGTYPLKIALLGGVVGFVVVNIAFKIIKNRISKNDMFCEVEINLNNKASNVKAMIDTGNLLKDPITGTDVIVVESEKLESIIPKEVLKSMNNLITGELPNQQEEIQQYLARVRVIPFSSLGKQNGMLVGFKPDSVVVKCEDMQKEINKVIVGIYDKKLSKSNDYTGLVGIHMMEEVS